MLRLRFVSEACGVMINSVVVFLLFLKLDVGCLWLHV